jgi:hypothetical protein
MQENRQRIAQLMVTRVRARIFKCIQLLFIVNTFYCPILFPYYTSFKVTFQTYFKILQSCKITDKIISHDAFEIELLTYTASPLLSPVHIKSVCSLRNSFFFVFSFTYWAEIKQTVV